MYSNGIQTTRFSLHATLIACIAFILVASAPTRAQTLRSSRFNDDGQTGVTLREDRYDPQTALTVEAWVLREDDGRCETIASHGFGDSFWFGFCPNLRFYRSGEEFADATGVVPKNAWTHVAASYDGETARFYINGEPAGESPLAHAGNGHDNALEIGISGESKRFWGYLDEIRIWSTVRTKEQIQSNLFEEVHRAKGLVAVFAGGDDRDAVSHRSGKVGSSVEPSTKGMLPSDLIVPRTPMNVTPMIDGKVNADLEYLGAEKMVLRYRLPGSPEWAGDVVALLAHDDDYLYVALDFLWIPFFALNDDTTSAGVMIDTDFGRRSVAGADDIMLRLNFTASDPKTEVFVGNTAGAFVPAPPEISDQVTAARAFSNFEFTAGSAEFRIARELLGDWDQIHGLALGIFELNDVDDIVAPAKSLSRSPATWARVVYGDGSAELPRVRVSGTVSSYGYSPDDKPLRPARDNADPLPDHEVTLLVNPTLSFKTTTDSDGNFAFDVPLPAAQQFTLLTFASCESCKILERATVDVGTPGAREITPNTVTFQGCPEGGDCEYPEVDFHVMRPPSRIQIDSASPVAAQTRVKLRQKPDKFAAGGRVTLHGRNLHPEIEVYLSPDVVSDIPADWVMYRAAVVSRSADGSTLDVQVPEIPPQTLNVKNGFEVETFKIDWRWVIKDNWVRPGYSAFRNILEGVRVTTPDYPLVYGFGFENKDDDGSLDEFLAVYGDNAYLCVGALGVCAGHVPDPAYWAVWYPVYRYLWINNSGGSCVGMSATSLQMRAGIVSPRDYNVNVNFPAGFIDISTNAVWENDHALGYLSGPPTPANLWATIRMNHGVQTSAEFIHHFLADSLPDASWPPISGNPNDRLEELRRQPLGQVISMSDDGGGHAVTAYRVDDDDPDNGESTIWIYDNEDPNNRARKIVVDRAKNEYTFRNSKGEIRRDGNRMMSVPLSVWSEERHAPGLGTDDPFSYMYLLIGGEANALYTTESGAQWGWQADGTQIGVTDEALAVVPMHNDLEELPYAPFMVPVDGEIPNIEVTSRGGDFIFHAAYGGTVLQLDARDASADARLSITPKVENGMVRSFAYNATANAPKATPRIAITPAETERIVASWANLDITDGGKARFTALPEERGVEYVNDSDAPTEHTLILNCADGASGKSSTCIFGPFEVPAGARQRTCIVDWPEAATLRTEIDTDQDGEFETTFDVTGVSCNVEGEFPTDNDGDGIPDACAGLLPDKPVTEQAPGAEVPRMGCGSIGLIPITWMIFGLSKFRRRQ